MAELTFPDKEKGGAQCALPGGLLGTTGLYFLCVPDACSCLSPFVSWAPEAGGALYTSGGKFPCSEEFSVALSHDVDL